MVIISIPSFLGRPRDTQKGAAGRGHPAGQDPVLPTAPSGSPGQRVELCFQYGDWLSNILWPTAMAPVCAGIAGVKVQKWWKWFVPLFLMLLATQMVTVAIALLINWQ